MAYAKTTAAQRAELNRFANIVAQATHRAREDGSLQGADVKPIVVDEAYVTVDVALARLKAAVDAAVAAA